MRKRLLLRWFVDIRNPRNRKNHHVSFFFFLLIGWFKLLQGLVTQNLNMCAQKAVASLIRRNSIWNWVSDPVCPPALVSLNSYSRQAVRVTIPLWMPCLPVASISRWCPSSTRTWGRPSAWIVATSPNLNWLQPLGIWFSLGMMVTEQAHCKSERRRFGWSTFSTIRWAMAVCSSGEPVLNY